ncbi:DNA polymerase beta domain protein region (modular protein) [uncultured Desulfobacterium sp.]|uniref:DNA polymerase beta domain protein region (Modular protein) n=1 Tax=uncultured Desulfobacterium sp. TaxID=201089 RepID=A0A445N0Y1_9BACT|nr:DNA polymerase beta domain protein region (modular protein) [uncultured Desulfobacterium sp.]
MGKSSNEAVNIGKGRNPLTINKIFYSLILLVLYSDRSGIDCTKVLFMKKSKALETLGNNTALLRDFHVSALYLFGSVVRDEAGLESDVDILVEFKPGSHVGLFHMVRLQRALNLLLDCKTDLVTPEALHPMLKDKILMEAVRVA